MALRAVVDALAEGGVRAIEVTMTVPRAIELIAEIAPTLPIGFSFGAGTVLDADTVARGVDAGAQFIVSPVFRPRGHRGLPRARVAGDARLFHADRDSGRWDAGADVVKVFPATALGPGYLKDVRAPLPQVKLMPTGGVTIDNAGDWIRAGAVARRRRHRRCSTPRRSRQGSFDVTRDNARRIVANVAAARG